MPDWLRIDKTIWFPAAVLLLTVPLNWLVGVLAAAMFHELCHVAAIYLLGGTIRYIYIGIFGAEIEVAPMSYRAELLCALAGPLGSMTLLLCCRWFPRMAICAFFQTVCNLFPVYPLDGGRILRCTLRILLPDREVLCSRVEVSVLCAITAAAVAAILYHGIRFIPLAAAVFLMFFKNFLQRRTTRGTMVLHHF